MTANEQASFQELLEYLKKNRGFDFTGYKPTSLGRRIRRRMQSIGIDSYAEYMDYLEVHPDEFSQLFNTILINVTGFFRDPEAWDYLAQEVVPRVLKEKPENEPLRIWSPGCATGDEAYTLAMVLAEELGPENFSKRVKIYATDIDEDALNTARMAAYNERQVEGIPPEYLKKYFEKNGNLYSFRKDLRRAVIFGRHDLIQDAPISRIDLLVCRNLLMYLNAETQKRVLSRLHFALSDNGFLFLGRAEMLLTHADLFNPVESKMRIFSRNPRSILNGRLQIGLAQNGSEDNSNQLMVQVRMRDAAFEIAPIAQIILNAEDILTQVNDAARRILGLNHRDLGRPFQDLQISYRPVELRSQIEIAKEKREPVTIREVTWPSPNGEERYLNIEIRAIPNGNGSLLGVVVSFIDITGQKYLMRDLARANEELETAMEELQSTNEELETSNEELQSTIEEIETNNEELQSTNEELETMNEELHSSNEELETMNEELRIRTEELNRTNVFLEAILGSYKGGVIVVDRDLNVLVWSRKAEDLWGVRATEAEGQNILSLDIGLPMEEIKRPTREVIRGSSDYQDVKVAAVNRRGKKIDVNVSIAPLDHHDHQRMGAILFTEEVEAK